MWKVKLMSREMNYAREIPGGQAWSQASLRLLQKGTADKKTTQLVNSLPPPRTRPLCYGISCVSSGWRPVWWLASLRCSSRTSKRRVSFFFYWNPLGSHFQRQWHLPSWLGSCLNEAVRPRDFWKTSGSMEGREEWNGKCSALTEENSAQLRGAGGKTSAMAQAGLASLTEGAGASDLPVCVSTPALHPTYWARTPSPPALGSPGISDPFCLYF